MQAQGARLEEHARLGFVCRGLGLAGLAPADDGLLFVRAHSHRGGLSLRLFLRLGWRSGRCWRLSRCSFSLSMCSSTTSSPWGVAGFARWLSRAALRTRCWWRCTFFYGSFMLFFSVDACVGDGVVRYRFVTMLLYLTFECCYWCHRGAHGVTLTLASLRGHAPAGHAHREQEGLSCGTLPPGPRSR